MWSCVGCRRGLHHVLNHTAHSSVAVLWLHDILTLEAQCANALHKSLLQVLLHVGLLMGHGRNLRIGVFQLVAQCLNFFLVAR